MKRQYFKVVQENGCVHIPVDFRRQTKIKENDIVRMCVYKNMVIFEKVEIPEVDMVKNLRDSFYDYYADPFQ